MTNAASPACAALLLSSLTLLSGAAAAQERDPFGFIDGVYSSVENCASGLEYRDGETRFLRSDGFAGVEEVCFFINGVEDAEGVGVIATGYCAELGHRTARLFYLMPLQFSEDEETMISIAYEKAGERIETLYHRCNEND